MSTPPPPPCSELATAELPREALPTGDARFSLAFPVEERGGGQGRLPRPGSDTPSFRALCGAGHAREPEPPGKEETLFAGIGHLTIGSSF